MFAGLPSLSHEQQQKAVERIRGIDVARYEQRRSDCPVAGELRANHTGERIVARFEDEDE